MNLWVDDTKLPPRDGWTWAKTIDEAITALKTGQVVDCDLDYDFRNDTRTGLSLLEWMDQEDRWPTMQPHVHSGNAIGALKMKAYILEHSPGTPRAKTQTGEKKPQRAKWSTGGSSRYTPRS